MRGRRTWVLVGLAVALVAVSTGTWFRSDAFNGLRPDAADAANAWQASSLWSAAVVLAVLAVVLVVAAGLVTPRAHHQRAVALAVVLAASGVGTWLLQAWDMVAPPPSGGTYVEQHYVITDAPVDTVIPGGSDLTFRELSAIHRDGLHLGQGLGSASGPTWLSVLGGALLLAILVVVVVEGFPLLRSRGRARTPVGPAAARTPRTWVLVVLAVALVAVSTRTWFHHDVPPHVIPGATATADAWEASSLWSAAVVLAVLAVVLVVAASLPRPRPTRDRAVALAAVLAAIAVATWIRQAWDLVLPPAPDGGFAVDVVTELRGVGEQPLLDQYAVHRDVLDLGQGLGSTSGPTWLSVLGGLLLLAILVVLFVQGVVLLRSRRDARNG